MTFVSSVCLAWELVDGCTAKVSRLGADLSAPAQNRPSPAAKRRKGINESRVVKVPSKSNRARRSGQDVFTVSAA